MASDRQQFAYALKKWDSLRRQGEYSVPSVVGRVAILVSGYGMSEDRFARLQEVNVYEREGYRINDQFAEQGISSFVLPRFDKYDMFEVLGDKEIASIITIGNGDLTSIYTSDESMIDWRHVVKGATHLKTGFFEQRHCGQAVRDLSVPLGTFAMKSHSAVRAAVNQFLPTAMTSDEERMIDGIHGYERLTYTRVKEILPHSYEDKDETPVHETPQSSFPRVTTQDHI